jgi:hypothetical protein
MMLPFLTCPSSSDDRSNASFSWLSWFCWDERWTILTLVDGRVKLVSRSWLLLTREIVEFIDGFARGSAGELYGFDRFDAFFRFAFGVWDRRERESRLEDWEARGELDNDKERNRVSGAFESESIERDGVDDDMFK